MESQNADERYQELAKKWLDKTITPEEQAEFAAWYNANQDNPIDIPPSFAENDEELRERILNKINIAIKTKHRTRIIPLRWAAVAASLLLLLSIPVIYFHLKPNKPKPFVAVHHKKQLKNDAEPGGDKAMLTLANGSVIDLNDAKKGVLANQGNALLRKLADGQIIYEAPKTTGSIKDSITYNTVTTPKGGQFQVVLSDGTKVWLNAASSIVFPTAFSSSERKVKITGEVYFEVAKNQHLPFRVVSGHQTVEVLGTHFNINAYEDENVTKTTLAEGSVKVYTGDQSAILKPDQQSSISNNGQGHIRINSIDVDDVLAWKNGNFQFEKAEIQMIMREAARWYDVDVKYDGIVPARRFTGSISRSVNLSELLKMLKYTGINFKIEGKTIIVTP